MFCNRIQTGWIDYKACADKGQYVWTVDSDKCTDIHDLHDIIVSKFENRNEWDLSDFGITGEEFFDICNPTDIIDSAGAWDDADTTMWIYNNICEPSDITALQLDDGAIVFDETLISKYEED
jgi:hypothetical protein